MGATRDLGLRVDWRAAFVGAGERVRTSPDMVAVDVGGDLCAGVIDHHAGTFSASSAAALLLAHPEYVYAHLVGPWIDAARRDDIRGRSWSPTVVTHRQPDFDAIASVALARQIVEHGDLPSWAEELARYATEVDQGRELLRAQGHGLELYPLILMLSGLKPVDATALAHESGMSGVDSSDAAVLFLGLELVRLWREASGPCVTSSASASSRTQLPAEHPVVARLAAEFRQDLGRFSLARAEGHVRPIGGDGLLEVPRRDGAATVQLFAAISNSAEEHHLSQICKHYLRSGVLLPHRASLTLIRQPSMTPGRFRWVIAIDPGVEGEARNACLAGLGVSLEAEETRRRGGLNGSGNASRRGPGRYDFAPGIADPWYDGRGHQLTIVDSPREGTVLEESDVLAVLRTRFWEPEVSWCRRAAWRDPASVLRADSGHQGVREEPPEIDDPLSATTGRARLGELIERIVDHEKSVDGSNILLAVACSGGWGREPIGRAARCLVGAGASEIEIGGLRIFVGSRGVLIQSEQEVAGDLLKEILAEVHRVEVLLRHLRTFDRMFAGGNLQEGARARTEHVSAVSKYHYRGVGRTSAESMRVAEALAEVHSIESRVRGLGDLLERLDDLDERKRGIQLNLIVLALGSTGIIQALSALLELTNWHEGRSWPLWTLLAMSFLLLALAAVVVSRRGRRLLLGSPWVRALVGGG